MSGSTHGERKLSNPAVKLIVNPNEAACTPQTRALLRREAATVEGSAPASAGGTNLTASFHKVSTTQYGDGRGPFQVSARNDAGRKYHLRDRPRHKNGHFHGYGNASPQSVTARPGPDLAYRSRRAECAEPESPLGT